MSSVMPVQQRLSRKPGFPLRLFAVAFVISLLSTIFGGWQSWQTHNHVEETSRKHIALTEDVGRIMLLDEVLTMSARMAAATGDFSYEKRYDQFDPQLTLKINEVRARLPRPEIERFVGETDEANLAMVKMERQAFALAHQGKRQEATVLLTSDEYMRLKKVYAGGMEKTVNAAARLIEKDTLHQEFLFLGVMGASAAGTLLILAAWFLAIGSARGWAAERRQAEHAILRLNEQLEVKVQERTRQLLTAQEELVRKEKLALLGQVAGSIGHELRNPLGVMSNAVYFLQTVLSDADDSIKEYLKIIQDEIAGSERIVSDLQDAVRTRSPIAQTAGIDELIAQTLRQCIVPAAVTVQLDLPATLPPLRVDAAQIQQVLRNLIRNGVEAMPQGGRLEISAIDNRTDGTIAVAVRDNGIGMTPDQLGKLFQPLFSTKARGIGLGLVVVQNLVQANGGSVQVASEVGKGSVFTVTLPSASQDGQGDLYQQPVGSKK